MPEIPLPDSIFPTANDAANQSSGTELQRQIDDAWARGRPWEAPSLAPTLKPIVPALPPALSGGPINPAGGGSSSSSGGRHPGDRLPAPTGGSPGADPGTGPGDPGGGLDIPYRKSKVRVTVWMADAIYDPKSELYDFGGWVFFSNRVIDLPAGPYRIHITPMESDYTRRYRTPPSGANWKYQIVPADPDARTVQVAFASWGCIAAIEIVSGEDPDNTPVPDFPDFPGGGGLDINNPPIRKPPDRGWPPLAVPPGSTGRFPGGGSVSQCRFEKANLDKILKNQDDILKRLGPEIKSKKGGEYGLSGAVQNVQKMQWLNQTLNILSVFFSLHNALMLSRNLTESVTGLLDVGLQAFMRVFRLSDPDEDAQIDVADLISKGWQALMIDVFGKEQWILIQAKIDAANRILQSASNVYFNVQSIFDGTRGLIEIATNNVSRIGNALKKSRIVGENDYKWMPVGINANSGRIEKLYETINNATELTDVLTGIAGEVVNISDESRELAKAQAELTKQLSGAQEILNKEDLPEGEIRPVGSGFNPENVPQTLIAESAKKASEASDISALDLFSDDAPWEFLGDPPPKG